MMSMNADVMLESSTFREASQTTNSDSGLRVSTLLFMSGSTGPRLGTLKVQEILPNLTLLSLSMKMRRIPWLCRFISTLMEAILKIRCVPSSTLLRKTKDS